jgi:DNA gyrase/topoisomerase IV subunit B
MPLASRQEADAHSACATKPYGRWRSVRRRTTISFLPNASIFKPSAFDVEAIGRTLGLITATTGLVVTLTDHRGSGEAG